MLDRYIHDIVLSFLVGCIACLSMASVNNADGRVFTMDLRGSSSLQGLRGAERACAMQNARLASGAELRRAVLECSFSACTRGWLYDGTVGTTECRNAGSSLTAMEVRTENTTDHMAHLNAFCIKDTGVPCGDPPSFPNTRLQGQEGFELGDELLYTCAPGHRMPKGHTAFSLLCDSCGEWYGLVQMCLKDESETHVDYEDRFPDSYGAPDDHSDPGQVAVEMDDDHVHQAAFPAVRNAKQKQQDHAVFTAGGRGGPERRGQQGEEARGEEELSLHAAKGAVVSQGAAQGVGGGEDSEHGDVEDDVPLESEQDRVVLVRSDVAVVSQATTAPVSQLSQKHMFWFPSEAFHEEGYPAPNDPVATADSDQSEESKEGRPDADADDLDGHRDEDDDGEREGYYDHDDNHDHRDDREESRHDEEQDDHNDSRHSDHDDHEDHNDGEDHDARDNSRQEEGQDEDLLSQHTKPYNPGQRDKVDRHRYDDDVDPRDHYDMGEHDDDKRDHVLYGGEREDAVRDHDVDEEDNYDQDRERDGDEESEDPREHDEHPEESEEDLDGETGEHDDDSDTDHDHYGAHDHTDDEENAETDDHDEHDDHDSHQDHEEDHEDDDDDDDVDRHPQVEFPLATDEPTTQEEAGRKPTTTTDQSWLDGYPIGPEEAEKGGSTEEEVPVVVAAGAGGAGVTDKPNEDDVLPEHPSRGPDSEQGQVGDARPGRIHPREPTPSPGTSHESQDSISSPDAVDYDHTDDPALAWDEEDPSERPFPDPNPGTAKDDADADNEVPLTGQAGERAPVEGEMGEAVCIGEDCPPPPPPTSSSRGPVVAAVIVAICAVATVAVVGAWLYRRRQQKNSMYQLNGKGHSQCTPDQQIEMQQKV